MRMTAADQLELGVIDGIIDEPSGGAHEDPEGTARAVRDAILAALGRVTRLDPETLLSTRYARLRRTGLVIETEAGPARAREELTLRRRIGRLLRIPGVPRRPRWSDVWPSGDDGNDTEAGA